LQIILFTYFNYLMYLELISHVMSFDNLFLHILEMIYVCYVLKLIYCIFKLDSLFLSCDEFVHYPKLS
jgi:hypothetical protein